MPSLPQGAFAVHKVKNKHQHVAVCKDNCSDEKPGRFDLKHNFSKLGPVKYNEKMMNSIWGRYNRNSPHNFKKNNAADLAHDGLQQPLAVAQKLSIAKENIPNQQSGLLLSSVVAAGVGSVGLVDKSQNNHHQQQQQNENDDPHHHAGHTHAHGHHGHFGHGAHDHSHYEQIWNFSVI